MKWISWSSCLKIGIVVGAGVKEDVGARAPRTELVLGLLFAPVARGLHFGLGHVHGVLVALQLLKGHALFPWHLLTALFVFCGAVL